MNASRVPIDTNSPRILSGKSPPITAAASPVEPGALGGRLEFRLNRANHSGSSPSAPMVMKMRAYPTVITSMTEVMPRKC